MRFVENSLWANQSVTKAAVWFPIPNPCLGFFLLAGCVNRPKRLKNVEAE